jgi:hypothetical protein
MAIERLRRLLATAAITGFTLLLAPMPTAAATPTPTPTPTPAVPTPRPVPASEPWWVQVAFAGHPVTQVRASGGTIAAAVAGQGEQQSLDGGRTWQPHFERHGLVIPPGPRWRVVDGRVGEVDAAGTWRIDPGSPAMAPMGPVVGDARGLVAAPASRPGVVVAVDRDGITWRRGADGKWARALLLLPQNIISGPPRVTALVAFDTVPLTDTVYMGTDGYSVLASSDGGDDWYRAGPGLPNTVDALYTDPTNHAVYAGTSDGLWVHHLRAVPRPPSYPDAALRWRWLGIALVTLAGTAVAAGGLLRVVR